MTVTLSDADAFYAELTTRNRGFVSERAQSRLAVLPVLVAGCGSTGGAAVEPLVRLGVQRFLLAEPGAYELNNLNRQSAFVDEIGENKADVHARRVAAVNPHAEVSVDRRGITVDNAVDLVTACGVVVDGVDVTEPAGWVAKWLLHEAAARVGRPVISGYDMAGTQYIRYYDYAAGSAPFDGRIDRAMLDEALATDATWDLLRRVVPMRVVPVEMLESARRLLASGEEGLPQLVYTSLLYGAAAARMVVSVSEGSRVRRHTLISVDRAVSTGPARWRSALRKPLVAVLALRELSASRGAASHG
jgi:tRNA threonylcarbamoyladenosine dehydratase